MVEVSGTYKHGRYERIWLKSLCIISNVKVFTMQDGQTASQTAAGQTNTTDYIDPCYSYGSKEDKHIQPRHALKFPSKLNDLKE